MVSFNLCCKKIHQCPIIQSYYSHVITLINYVILYYSVSESMWTFIAVGLYFSVLIISVLLVSAVVIIVAI